MMDSEKGSEKGSEMGSEGYVSVGGKKSGDLMIVGGRVYTFVEGQRKKPASHMALLFFILQAGVIVSSRPLSRSGMHAWQQNLVSQLPLLCTTLYYTLCVDSSQWWDTNYSGVSCLARGAGRAAVPVCVVLGAFMPVILEQVTDMQAPSYPMAASQILFPTAVFIMWRLSFDKAVSKECKSDTFTKCILAVLIQSLFIPLLAVTPQKMGGEWAQFGIQLAMFAILICAMPYIESTVSNLQSSMAKVCNNGLFRAPAEDSSSSDALLDGTNQPATDQPTAGA